MSIITKEELKKIVELSESVPEQYRNVCFEILLKQKLQGITKPPEKEVDKKDPKENPEKGEERKFIIPIDVKAFLNQYNLRETDLWKLFFVDGNEVRTIYNLNETKRSKVQIQLALLLSLENALKNGQFQTTIEDLRQKCVDLKSYESKNFMNNLNNNAKFFKTVDKDQALVLSPDGKSELADIIETMNGSNG